MLLIQHPIWLELILHGEQNQKHSTGEVCWNTDVFYFDFKFISPKWTRTKIVIEINSAPTGLILSTACTGRLGIPLNIS